jgi:hypothetical protein
VGWVVGCVEPKSKGTVESDALLRSEVVVMRSKVRIVMR